MDNFNNNENNLNNMNNENVDLSNDIIDCTTNESYANNLRNSFEPQSFNSEPNQSAYSSGSYLAENNYANGMNNSYEQQNSYANNVNFAQNNMNNTGYNNESMNQGYQQFNYQPNQQIAFNPIDEAQNEAKKEKRAKIIKGVKRVAIAAACCVSIGVGVGAGFDVSKNYVAQKENEESLNFKFPEVASNEEEIVKEDNVVLTGTNTIAPIINKVKDSVVNISIKAQTTNFFNQVFESTGAGSGIIYEQDEEKVYIVTNNHVIEGASTVQISITGTEQVNASLVGKDPSSDLALISVLKKDLAAVGINEVKPAVFANSDQMEVGEYVLAVGNALGEGKTVTQGIISAQNKQINIDGNKLTVLQTDAAINPGNSGGALINTDGEVVGINTAKFSSSSVEGIGYAIPSTYAKNIIAQLKENGSIEKPYLGIIGFTINDSFKRTYNLNIDGVFLTEVEQGSSAANAGLKYTDIITGFNGQQIKSIEELSAAIAKCKAGDTVSIEFIRNGITKMNVQATLNNYNQRF